MALTRFAFLVHPRSWLLALALATLGLVSCGGSDDDEQFVTSRATLSGAQEVPPVSTPATGTGTLTLGLPSRTLSGGITISGMTANAAHIHEGAPGVSGPIIVPLVQGTPGTWSVPVGTVLTEAQAQAFSAGNLYFNAHSVAFPNGEIRGQIGREVFTVPMSGAQEVPPTASAATGVGRLVVDPVTRKLASSMTLTGMTATMAHIHTGAAGTNGPIIIHFSETAPGSRIWVSPADATFTDAQLTQLRAGGLYFNAHSVAYPGGEIRGQIR